MHSEILLLEMLQETADLFTFTKEILNGKLHFCAVSGSIHTLKTETETIVDMIQILM